MTKIFILDFLKTHRAELRERFGVEKIALFGSYAKDSATEESDVDLLIETDKKDFFVRSELKEYLENNFNTTVDIAYFDSLRKYYRSKIANEIIYA